jgi:hypothetical protein
MKTQRLFAPLLFGFAYLALIAGLFTGEPGFDGGRICGRSCPDAHHAGGYKQTRVEFKAPTYAQSMRGRLLVFKPTIVSRCSSMFFTATNRKHPVVLEGEAYSETVKIKLPAQFSIPNFPLFFSEILLCKIYSEK